MDDVLLQWYCRECSRHCNFIYSNIKRLNFVNDRCIGRKDRLLRTVNTMRRIHGKHYDFHPEGFILPGEKDAFIRQVTNDLSQNYNTRLQTADNNNNGNNSSRRPSSASIKYKDLLTRNNEREKLLSGGTTTTSAASPLGTLSPPSSSYLWIVKPVASSCGKGISVMTGQQAVASLSKKKKVIMQRYIDDPYLIDGKKFDLRICKIDDKYFKCFTTDDVLIS